MTENSPELKNSLEHKHPYSDASINHCPCGSGQTYKACCGPYHSGQAAPTAEALMRSRFSAYYLKNTDYLLATTWQRQINGLDKADIHRETDATRWTRLDLVSTEAGGSADSRGKVEFKAWFLNPATGREEAHHEHSDFIREQGHWYFIYPDIPARLPGRNDPCLCGSGKKYKKCCG
ncbi:YchJ family protein [Endozoicomonas sp. ALD040]|uniref:YchJ family protein n=1 Tax=Endozoicomonas sp. ALD040 TaxID=3403079 RepID=UPI003BAE6F76